jgi:hypothetical protein
MMMSSCHFVLALALLGGTAQALPDLDGQYSGEGHAVATDGVAHEVTSFLSFAQGEDGLVMSETLAIVGAAGGGDDLRIEIESLTLTEAPGGFLRIVSGQGEVGSGYCAREGTESLCHLEFINHNDRHERTFRFDTGTSTLGMIGSVNLVTDDTPVSIMEPRRFQVRYEPRMESE